MKPRNRIEREVVALSHGLSHLTEAQYRWMVDNVVGNKAYCTKKKGWCLECGKEFPIGPDVSDGDEIVCPHCQRKASVVKTQARKCRNIKYAQVLTICKGWQVIRYYEFEWFCNKGEMRRLYEREVFQKWCRPGRKMITLGKNICAYPYRCWSPFSEYGGLSVKESDWCSEWMDVAVYPVMRVLPLYKRCGFDGRLPMKAEDLFGKVFSNPFTEMLYKQGNDEMLRDAIRYDDLVNKYWPSIRVALRHKFKIGALRDYLDYLGMLKYLKKDLHNPKYVAPADYGKMHFDVLQETTRRKRIEMEEKQRKWELERIARDEEKKKRLEKAKADFAERIAKFADLDITDGTIDIRPLMTIKEFEEEGNAMHHCVYSNEYFAQEDSLILSARIDGKRIETIEVDMKDFHIAQSRGVCNGFSDHHDAIVALMMSGMPVVQKMSGRKQKQRVYANA